MCRAPLRLQHSADLGESRKPISDLSIDERGEARSSLLLSTELIRSKLCHHGPTSAVHDPPTNRNRFKQGTSTRSSVSSEENMRTSLVSKATQLRGWEDPAVGNAAIEVGIPKNVHSELL